ncbi:LamG-like jellyroll fold domain-containing protein [Sphingomonas sp. PB2P19]|uniref:glycosyl hydrolase 2 galactose-binding domain-containing protein n=1 Tax=Sphingomonas rhamnosi TaxID=3096156 RepID=UPI002FC7669E
MTNHSIRRAGPTLLALLLASVATAQTPVARSAAELGPYNVDVAAGGATLVKSAGAADAVVPATAAWTIQAWIEPRTIERGQVSIAGIGTVGAGRFLALIDGRPALITAAGTLSASKPLVAGQWRHLAAVAQGDVARLYVDGIEVARGAIAPAPVAAIATIAPHAPGTSPFAGRIAGFGQTPSAVAPATLKAITRPDATIRYEPTSPSWPVQTRQMAGQVTPQYSWTLPRSRAPLPRAVAKPIPRGPALAERAPGLWTVAGWRLAEAPKVSADGAVLSRSGYDAAAWYVATVPGTVLTTLVDRGVYADPAFGLNNLAIPETLARQDYWYRTEIDVPAGLAGRRLALNFKGVNYAAEVWVNGVRLGTMKGAFIRGRFDVSSKLVAGRNAIAVKVSPPPHPGLAHEESLTAGVGENGGMQMLDGPTFVASEGWDWIPTVRDRNTGLWQGVDLIATGAAALGDAQVVTTLPNPDNSVANVEITTPVSNLSDRPVSATVTARFDDVVVSKSVTLAPGASTDVTMAPGEFPALAVRNPKLWWPNGYGAPALHGLTLTSTIDGTVSDTRTLRFGMRQVTYEISLMDKDDQLRRVGLDLSKARALGTQIVDGTHQGIRQTDTGWAASLVAGAETSPAVTPVAGDAALAPYLLLKVNSVRIAARGGNIGMDDFMKRTERERLLPFFRLHQDANLNIIRNWVGQNTEETFYDLADEHGLMILNDFWESTQDYNIEAQDVPLFAANAEDVVRRFRNHPSIVAWFGRNEGVPQPILNEKLQAIINREDGTRLYMGSSNRVNLQNSGPYNWRPEASYFTDHAKGFSVELGTPSFPTLEAWTRAMPKADLWPISDAWAYHDWHQTGNGAVKTYMDVLATRYGAGTSLGDFERKAQMMEYDSYRAIFEGFNAGLWTTNSARMLWMTQPAWPSSAWQIFSSDYDTHAAFYGTKKASEPVHVQMNLPDHQVMLVNNGKALAGAVVHAKVTTLDNRVLAEQRATVSAGAGLTTTAFTLDLAPLLAQGMVLVALDVTDAAGTMLSNNVYWQGANDQAYRDMTRMPQAVVAATAASRTEDGEIATTLNLANDGPTAALATKITVMNADGTQVLPAYFTDNYVSLLPGQRRRIEIRYPATAAKGRTTIALRGWNVTPTVVTVR